MNNITRGYGFRVDDILSFKENAFINLVKEYPTLQDILELSEDYDNTDVRNAIEEFVDEREVEGLAAVNSYLKEEKYNIDTEAIPDNSGYVYVVLPARFPWEYNKKVSLLTHEDIDDVFEEILSILTEDKPTIKIHYIEE